VKVSLEADEDDDWEITGCKLLDNALFVTNNESGQLVIPHRLGLLMRADGGLPDTRRFRAYANANAYSMAFAGAVKNGSAVMVTWEDPYSVIETRSTWIDDPLVPGSQMLSLSLAQTQSARSFTIYPLGAGDYVQIGKSYRPIAKKRGLLRPWAEKLKQNPDVERMFGAADFKPFVFVRVVPHTRGNDTDQERLHIGYTFEEAAQIAEHLKNDLGVGRAMYVLAGWIHRGYDNQHPDILPAAPECGGDEGLTDCSKRVRDCGYLFGLHDNYQDMYRDAPSWDESYIMKSADGSLRRGGQWAGGQAYLTCSKKALALAKRPQNLVEVRRLFRPTIYFIDTTYAAPPYECHDPEHPLSLRDDIYWKNELAKYARGIFGLFGSEEGQEWAVPDADYFEGLMSHKTGHGGQDVIPLFEIVYGDCINLYTHQGDRASPARSHRVRREPALCLRLAPVLRARGRRGWAACPPGGRRGEADRPQELRHHVPLADLRYHRQPAPHLRAFHPSEGAAGRGHPVPGRPPAAHTDDGLESRRDRRDRAAQRRDPRGLRGGVHRPDRDAG
jgi:hypothetical protein